MNMNRVGIFWDYENCAPPSGIPGYVVAERLRATCGAYGSVTQFRAYLELSTPPPTTPSQSASAGPSSNDLSCPPTSPKTLALRSELQSSGVSLIDCPHNSRKNVADSMLACDLVCFALDNPSPQIPCANYLPASSYSIPNTPFSAIFPAPLPAPKTTIVLISGDRDFAYPLAVLKARKYEVGLIVPPGGAHPALRAQATWVMNWKDVLEGNINTDGRYDATASITPRGRPDNVAMDNQINGFTQGIRRPSFASRRGSISSSRRGSVSASPNPVPPPPHLATTSAARIPVLSGSFSTPEANEYASTSLASHTPQPEGTSTSQPFSASRPTRKSPLRRPAAKAGSRPPSRTKSRVGGRPNRSERTEQEDLQPLKLEQPRPHPLIVPVPLTSSPIGSTGPSLAGMSPRAGRPQTPPLFSTNPTSPPPPAPPALLPPPPTPPTKVLTPPAKPPSPPRDALRSLHRPPIPHVATPRPPVPESCQSAVVGASCAEEKHLDVPASTSTLVAPTPKSSATVLQSLLPAAIALRSPIAGNPIRPMLAVPPSVQASSTSTLTPATPVTPPASPPFRWTRLQPVHDDTDGDGERSTNTEKKRKEKAKDRVDPVRGNESHSLANLGEAAGSTCKKNSMRLAVQVGMLLGGEEPSATSGVDSILRSYTERSPKVEQDDQKHRSSVGEHDSLADPIEQQDGANVLLNLAADEDDEEEEEEEERFHETFLATFSRPPICPNAPRTPATVKLVSLELTTEENTEGAHGTVDHKRPRITTPRPVPRSSHSLPTLIPIMHTLLAGVEGGQPIPNIHSDVAAVRPQSHEAPTHETAGGIDAPERLYSRTNSPRLTVPPPTHRRRTSPSRIPGSSSDMTLNPLVEATYREFQFLINILERCRRNGQERPLRSFIGAEFARDVFEQPKATPFKEHVQRAVAAGVVSVGGGLVQGREWISLNRNWQGLGLVID
ncbi:unnamed protein product [Rhizoctonia solani]|uniref:NYN domain-containing protein n=1 Tax=Rhizoctonia solani TaxID=456999 RepID=A0A8H2XFV7_9AGAM|nr:unnamed protein product [Rhizoctonia solani]